MLTGEKDPGIFIFSTGDTEGEEAASIQEESSLNTGTLVEGLYVQGPEIMIESQGMSHQDAMGRLTPVIQRIEESPSTMDASIVKTKLEIQDERGAGVDPLPY